MEAARSGRLPRLLRLAELRGDLHTRTTASDAATAEEMAEAARALGHRYLAICDHSRSLAIARGLTTSGAWTPAPPPAQCQVLPINESP